MHHKHRFALAALGVFDGAPRCRDDAALDGGYPGAGRVQIPSVTQQQSDYGEGRDEAECQY